MDEGPIQYLLYIGFAIVATMFGVAAWLAEKRKREALVAFAAQYGWRLRLERSRARPRFPSDLFDKGHSRWTRYHMDKTLGGVVAGSPGDAGSDVDAFEYHYAITTGSGKNRRTHHYYFTCVIATSPVPLGEVFIRDEHLGDKLVQGLGFDDIDLEDPEFSTQFVVKASDRKDAYDLLGPSLMTHMLSWSGLSVQTHGTMMLVTMNGRLDPHDVMNLERFVRGFFGCLPRVLVNNARVASGLAPMTEAGDVRASPA